MNYATVNPANTSDISTVDLDGQPMRDGSTVRIPDYAGGERRFTINNGAVPVWNLYDLVLDTTTVCDPPEYYNRTTSYAFAGTVGVSGTVTETATCNQIPISDLYNIRIEELRAIASRVFDQGVQVTLESNGVQDVHTRTEFALQYNEIAHSAGGAYGLTGGLPAITNFRVPDLWGRWFAMQPGDAAPGKNLRVGLGLHYTTTNAVAENHENQMQALRDAGDWAGLAAYDLTADWPEAPTDPRGQQMSVTQELSLTRTVQIDTLSRALRHPRIQGTPGDVGKDVSYVYRFLLRHYAIRDDSTALFAQWLAEHPGA